MQHPGVFAVIRTFLRSCESIHGLRRRQVLYRLS